MGWATLLPYLCPHIRFLAVSACLSPAQPHVALVHRKICFWLACSLWFILARRKLQGSVLRSATRLRFAALVILRANAAFGSPRRGFPLAFCFALAVLRRAGCLPFRAALAAQWRTRLSVLGCGPVGSLLVHSINCPTFCVDGFPRIIVQSWLLYEHHSRAFSGWPVIRTPA